MELQQNFIDGRFEDGADGERIEVLNPARDTVFSHIVDGRRRSVSHGGEAGAGLLGEAAHDPARGLPAPELRQDPRQRRGDRARRLVAYIDHEPDREPQRDRVAT